MSHKKMQLATFAISIMFAFLISILPVSAGNWYGATGNVTCGGNM